MKVDDDKIQAKLKLYHDKLRNGEDTTQIKAEINAYTMQYVDNVTSQLDGISSEFDNTQQNIRKGIKSDISFRKEYLKLIDLYRRAKIIADTVSKYKKALREMKK